MPSAVHQAAVRLLPQAPLSLYALAMLQSRHSVVNTSVSIAVFCCVHEGYAGYIYEGYANSIRSFLACAVNWDCKLASWTEQASGLLGLPLLQAMSVLVCCIW